jgi:hypothetical protein
MQRLMMAGLVAFSLAIGSAIMQAQTAPCDGDCDDDGGVVCVFSHISPNCEFCGYVFPFGIQKEGIHVYYYECTMTIDGNPVTWTQTEWHGMGCGWC